MIRQKALDLGASRLIDRSIREGSLRAACRWGCDKVASSESRDMSTKISRRQVLCIGSAGMLIGGDIPDVATTTIRKDEKSGDAFKCGHATAHDGTTISFEVHGTGEKFLLFGFGMEPRSASAQAFIDELGRDYRLILADYPGEPKMYTLTPATAARDYLEIATAAGADEFAFYGYSVGAVCGLQVALRTDRMKAFVAGGFPMLRGPYSEVLESLRKVVFGTAATTWKSTWEVARQYLTYYEGLRSFNERAIQGKLKMPRLNFVGMDDRAMELNDGTKVDFYGRAAESRSELQAAGWQVMFLPGEDHGSAAAPKVVTPLVRKWLAENWPN